ncbi:host attachment protein [Noviherbaspirillum sedimenti]|uniref:Host attachment protein n=1 Tax=Noviherbaspirillum sedimenti TaxID=2320865 RepID=A0A3A3FZM7_9BURK|nr:host attachment protein [Noviherbaspirillum sedimenti]RJG00835.1 host attachment protein [Noviherbaspirillum sedimenti]
MQTTWILAADSSRVRIFQELDAEHHLQEVQDFANPAGHAKGEELLTGNPERRNMSKGTLGGTHDGQAETSPIEHENIQFSKEIGDYLEQARSEQRFDRLCVIAAPHFLGLLRQNLSKEAQKLVQAEIDKDIAWFDKTDIEKFVQNWQH